MAVALSASCTRRVEQRTGRNGVTRTCSSSATPHLGRRFQCIRSCSCGGCHSSTCYRANATAAAKCDTQDGDRLRHARCTASERGVRHETIIRASFTLSSRRCQHADIRNAVHNGQPAHGLEAGQGRSVNARRPSPVDVPCACDYRRHAALSDLSSFDATYLTLVVSPAEAIPLTA